MMPFLVVSGAVLSSELLDSLTAEGNTVVIDESGMASHQPGAVVDQSLMIPMGSDCRDMNQDSGNGELVGGLSRSDFERILKRDYCATSLFYKNISPLARQQVYDAYLLDSDLTTLRELILSKIQ